MPSLAEFQSQLRGAIVSGDAAPMLPLLTGGREPEKRLAIHLRHFESSLTRALVEKFPTVAWLTGAEFIAESARIYVREQPPVAPCIAEYGEGFPAYLASRPGAERVPYLRFVGELEWHLGHVALALDAPPLAISALSGIAEDRLPDVTLTLQPGLRYLAAAWPVDELVKLHLSENAPERFRLDAEDVFLEVHGARGRFDIARLDAASFSFRKALARGGSIGAAAEQALETDPLFEPGQALAGLFAAGLVTAASDPASGQSSEER